MNRKIILGAALSIGSVFVFSGCAHSPLADSPSRSITKPQGPLAASEDAAEAKAIEKLPASQNGDLTVSSSDVGEIHMEINTDVERWIQYFQGRGRGYFERYLERSSRYVPIMKKVLKQNNVPEDLIYIAMIESGFSGKIRSRAKAVGFWQFIGGTGKHYGLRVSSLMDERYDPVRSTEAAAAYFKGLYNLFGNWYLAIASYNVGENRIKNMVMKNYTRDFWELARRKQLPPETTQYIPKFLAARQISLEPEKYGFTGLNYAPPMAFDTITSDQPVDLRALAKAMKIDYTDLKDLNPSLKTQFSPVIDGKASVRVPVGTANAAHVALSDAIVKNKRYITQSNDTPSQVSFTRYRVKHGETLSAIAARFEVSIDEILKVNTRIHKNRIRQGMTLKIPSSAFNVIKEKKYYTRNTASTGGLIYIVRRGDNLSHIAKRHDTTIQAIIKANNLAENGRVFKGQKLVIPSL